MFPATTGEDVSFHNWSLPPDGYFDNSNEEYLAQTSGQQWAGIEADPISREREESFLLDEFVTL